MPFILQDFGEIGSDPDTIINLKKKHLKGNPATIKVLDLGCGKGAVSVKTAEKLGCSCHGTNAIPEFIDFARVKASEYGVENLCTFETGDIREIIKRPGKYNVIILVSIGPVLGDYFETLSKLKHCLHETGFIIIDDGYIEDKGSVTHLPALKKNELLKQVDKAGMLLTNEVAVIAEGKKIETYDAEYINLEKRCIELINRYPEKANLFHNFLLKQQRRKMVL